MFCSLTSVIVFFVSLVCHGLIFLICELFVVMLLNFLFASVFVPLFVGPLNVLEVRRRFCSVARSLTVVGFGLEVVLAFP